ncbi:unnamed protein product [Cylicostephanus goldi]|uniref:Uncharacterized protein n=1 Tax=Cylicostephanus goldi TaxID=71465 RepID=A0A3P6SFM2_CYLGO|nr:unnamed protein product [Cylicostephanus goldi]
MLEDIYAPIEEDVDLTRILVDFNAENMAGVGAGDVLHTLDSVLDKTIDYFRQHKTKISPEVEEIIAKREALKAAMLETMLTVPRFLPSDWVKQFEVYQQEALRETSGINWARIMLLYPKYRTFEDGEADIFGNFTRARRSHWLMGIVFGPLDSKTFEEVDREIKSQVRSQHSSQTYNESSTSKLTEFLTKLIFACKYAEKMQKNNKNKDRKLKSHYQSESSVAIGYRFHEGKMTGKSQPSQFPYDSSQNSFVAEKSESKPSPITVFLPQVRCQARD